MVPRASGPVFMFCAPGLIFDGTEGVGSRFHVLRARTNFRRYGGHRVLFSCFVLPNSFSAVPSALGPVFMFCAFRLIFGGTEGVRSRIHVLRSHTRFRRYRGVRSLFHVLPFGTRFGGTECVGSRFHVLRYRTRCRRYRGRQVPFLCFALPDSFLAVPRVSGPAFMFYVPELIFGGTESVGSHFHVVCLQTRFWRCRGRRVPFS
jgi:hypothetical protein